MSAYLLRSNGHYLMHVSPNGLRAIFDRDRTKAKKFDAEQRAKFRETHPHIKGIWVELKAEEKRAQA